MIMSRKILWLVGIAAIVTLVVVTLMIFGGRESRTIRIGYVPIADGSQVFVALEQGFFQKRGITVELVQMTSGPKILEALGAGSIDLGLTSTVPLLVARESGLDFIAITGGPVEDKDHAEHAIVVRRDSAIDNVGALRGKRIAISGLRNIDDFMVTALLAKNGVNRSEITFTEVPFPRMPTVIEAGGVDAAAAIEPFVTLATQKGAARVLVYNYIEVLPRVPVATWVVRKQWADKHPDLAIKIHAALAEATKFIQANESQVRDIVGKCAKLDKTVTLSMNMPLFTETLSDEDILAIAIMAKQAGLLKQEVQPALLSFNAAAP
jgi:NitT/TauT family transport system substrate-binding protein